MNPTHWAPDYFQYRRGEPEPLPDFDLVDPLESTTVIANMQHIREAINALADKPEDAT